ncbi:hypothetical protein AALO_G00136710, partial [Alosa alosa]
LDSISVICPSLGTLCTHPFVLHLAPSNSVLVPQSKGLHSLSVYLLISAPTGGVKQGRKAYLVLQLFGLREAYNHTNASKTLTDILHLKKTHLMHSCGCLRKTNWPKTSRHRDSSDILRTLQMHLMRGHQGHRKMNLTTAIKAVVSIAYWAADVPSVEGACPWEPGYPALSHIMILNSCCCTKAPHTHIHCSSHTVTLSLSLSHTHTHTHTHIQAHTITLSHTHTYIYIHIYRHKHTHTHTSHYLKDNNAVPFRLKGYPEN